MTIENQIVRLHRWFGLIMCLFFVAWFISGFVMLYVDFPQYSQKNLLSHQAVLPLGCCAFVPARLSSVLSQDTSWKRIRLNMLLDRPVIRMENNEAKLYAFYISSQPGWMLMLRFSKDDVFIGRLGLIPIYPDIL
jgi:hypothetical protein